MNSIILYGSRHHGNTRKLAEAIAQKHPVDLLDADAGIAVDLTNYDLIGFASGLDFGKFYPSVTGLAKTLPAGKRVFAIFTCARDNGKYGDEIRDIAAQRNCIYLGKFGCKGYNTYGPWKLIGGMNRNHPSFEEREAALRFYEGLLEAIDTERY